MVAPNVPFSTVGGYGANPSLVLDPGTGLAAGLLDATDGFPILFPGNNPSGGLTAVVVNPIPVPIASGMPEINAIICELRVISALLREQMGDTGKSCDLQIMRADEFWNTTIGLGSL